MDGWMDVQKWLTKLWSGNGCYVYKIKKVHVNYTVVVLNN